MYENIDVNILMNEHLKSKYKSEEIYHNTKELLTAYPKVLWKIKNQMLLISDEGCEYGNVALKDLIDIYSDQLTQYKIEEKLQNIAYSTAVINSLNKCMEILKEYPVNGDFYYKLLKYSYFANDKPSESYILEQLSVSRSTYFRMKKEAINLLGIILWGYEVPKVMNMFEL